MSEYKQGNEVVSHRVIKSVDECYEYPLDMWEERIYQQGRADAIDEFVNEIKKVPTSNSYKSPLEIILLVAEQLKEKKDE